MQRLAAGERLLERGVSKGGIPVHARARAGPEPWSTRRWPALRPSGAWPALSTPASCLTRDT